MKSRAFVYIMTNKPFGTLYVGMTNDLWRRIWEHKHKMIDGFTKRYDLTRLVYYEELKNVEEAARREKQLKAWKRGWKLRLIMEKNPDWQDLYNEFLDRENMDPDLRQDLEGATT